MNVLCTSYSLVNSLWFGAYFCLDISSYFKNQTSQFVSYLFCSYTQLCNRRASRLHHKGTVCSLHKLGLMIPNKPVSWIVHIQIQKCIHSEECWLWAHHTAVCLCSASKTFCVVISSCHKKNRICKSKQIQDTEALLFFSALEALDYIAVNLGILWNTCG